MKVKIDCASCEFVGSLTFSNTEISKSDIAYCPVCGGDVSLPYNLSDDEIETDE
jgi:hypothetical protein